MIRYLLSLITVSVLMWTLPSQAQNEINVNKSPSLKVIGFYSLSADKVAHARFIREQIDFHDPANFSEEQKAMFRRLGRGDSLQPFTDNDRREWENHLRLHMDDAAMFEVLMTSPDTTFDVGKFIQPDPSQPQSLWQVAWNEKFLSPDGERLLEVGRYKLPDREQYRVVFVIHHWKPKLPLRSSSGELDLPSMQQPLPERLWRLAPYELPD